MFMCIRICPFMIMCVFNAYAYVCVSVHVSVYVYAYVWDLYVMQMCIYMCLFIIMCMCVPMFAHVYLYGCL